MDREKDEGNGQENGADSGPNFGSQRGHEREEARLLFHWFLDHNTDAQLHEWCTEVYHPFPGRRDGDGSQGNVRLL